MEQVVTPLIVHSRESLLKKLDLAGKSCIEIGVQQGNFSKEIVLCNPALLYLVDPWKHYVDGTYNSLANLESQEAQDALFSGVVKRFSKYPKVKILRKTSVDAVSEFHQASIDFIYVDANHTFEYVLADLFLWYPKIRQNGWLTGHDYHKKRFPGVVKAVEVFMKVTGEKLGMMTSSLEEDVSLSWAIQKTQRN